MIPVIKVWINVVSFVSGLFVNKKFLNYKIREQLWDYIPSLLLSALMGVPVFLLSLLQLPTLITLMLQAITGVCVYVFVAVLGRIFLKEKINKKTAIGMGLILIGIVICSI